MSEAVLLFEVQTHVETPRKSNSSVIPQPADVFLGGNLNARLSFFKH